MIGAAIAAGALAPALLQQRTIHKLEDELAALRAQPLSDIRKEAPVPGAPESDQLREDRQELMRLRAEITALRQTAAGTQKPQTFPHSLPA